MSTGQRVTFPDGRRNSVPSGEPSPSRVAKDTAIILEILAVGCTALVCVLFESAYPIIGFTVLWLAFQHRKPHRLFFLLVLLYPFSYTNYTKPMIGPVEINIDEVILLLIVAYTFVWRRRENQERLFRVNKQFTLLYSAGVLVSGLAVGDSAANWVTSMGYVLTFYATIYVIRSEDQFGTVIKLLKVSALIIAVSAVLSAYGIIDVDFLDIKTSVHRTVLDAKYASTGLIRSRGGFGVNMAFILPFILDALLTRRRKTSQLGVGGIPNSVYHVTLFCTIIYSIIVSASRSTWLMALVVVAVYLLMIARRKINRYVIDFFVLPVLFLSLLFTRETFTYFYQSIYDMAPETVDSRLTMDLLAFDVFRDNLLFGIHRAQILDIGGMGITIHNFFLHIAADSGLLGVVPVCVVFAVTGWMLWKLLASPSEKTRQVAGCLAAAYAGILVELSFYSGGEKQIWMYIALFSAYYAIDARRTAARSSQLPTPEELPIASQSTPD